MSIEKMLFIEDNIYDLKNKTILELVQEGRTLQEVDYIMRAIRLPFAEVMDFMQQGMDLETLPQSREMAEFCIKLGSDVDSIMKRIQELRRLSVFKEVQGSTRK